MGQMRFLIPQPRRVTEEAAGAAYLSGIDRIAWPCRSWIEGSQLVVQRSVSDSGNLHIPWQVEGFGPVTLSTTSLAERAEPYVLPLELARGVLAQLRDQLSDWQMIGLDIAEEIHEKTSRAMGHLHLAATGQENPIACAQSAELAIGLGFEAGEMLAVAYAEQSMAARLSNGEKLGTVFVPHERRMSSRRRWIGQASRPAGRIIVDSGAASALLKRGKSLLPSGITAVVGKFAKGAVVLVVDMGDKEIARGLTNYSAAQLQQIKGLRTSSIAAVLGDKPYDEVIHRNNLTLS